VHGPHPVARELIEEVDTLGVDDVPGGVDVEQDRPRLEPMEEEVALSGGAKPFRPSATDLLLDMTGSGETCERADDLLER